MDHRCIADVFARSEAVTYGVTESITITQALSALETRGWRKGSIRAACVEGGSEALFAGLSTIVQARHSPAMI